MLCVEIWGGVFVIVESWQSRCKGGFSAFLLRGCMGRLLWGLWSPPSRSRGGPLVFGEQSHKATGILPCLYHPDSLSFQGQKGPKRKVATGCRALCP